MDTCLERTSSSMSVRAHEVLGERVVRVDAAVPVCEMLAAIRERRAAHVAVFANGQCLGVSSLHDVDLAADDTRFGDLVDVWPCISVSDSIAVEELGRAFTDTKFDVQVVHDDQGEFIGVVTRQSLLEGLLKERQETEESLRQGTATEQLLHRAQQIAHVGSFVLAADGSPTYWSDECFRIIGLEPKSEPPSRAYFLQNVIHPDDRGLSQRTVQQALEECVSFDYEYRVLRPDRSVRWVRARGKPLCDAGHQIVSVEGTLLDITDSKLAADALVEMNVAFSNAMPGISRLDI